MRRKVSSEGNPWEGERELDKAGVKRDEEKGPPLRDREERPQPELSGMHGG